MHYTLEPFRAEHLAVLQIRPYERSLLGGQDPVEAGRAFEGNPGWTILADGQPVACVGLLLQWRGVGTVWAFPGADIRRHTRAFLYYSRHLLASYWTHLRLHRVQAFVQAGNLRARRFVEHLGLEHETALAGWGPQGDTYLLYSRVEV